jgi:hypothetical protein
MAAPDAPVFSFRANWREPMVERLAFLTDVLQAKKGAEQRRSLRRTPRRSYEADFLLSGNERTFWDLFQTRIGIAADIYAPLYWDVQALAIPLLSLGADRIDFDTTFREFEPGYAILQGRHALDYEVVEIVAVDAGGIDLAASAERTWPAGTKLMPLRRGVIEDSADLGHLSARVATTTGRIRLIEPNPWTPAADPSPVYEGLPVFSVEPNWVDRLTTDFEHEFAEIDNQTGLPDRVDVLERALAGQQHRWFLRGREALAEFRDLIYRHRGRRGSFWLPTFKGDLRLASAVASDATELVIENVGFHYAGGPASGREYLAIKHDGGTIYRQIVGTSAGATFDTEKIELDAAPGLALAPGQVRRMSFMDTARFDQDEFEITHHGGPDSLHEANAVFRTFKNSRDPSGVIYFPIPETAMNSDPCGVINSFNGLAWLLPCQGSISTNVCACASSQSDSYVVGGDIGTVYDVTLRVRGVVELVTYSGGVAHGGEGFCVKDATSHDPDNFNVYRLDVSDPPASFYLNDGDTSSVFDTAVDYEIVVPIRGGATITLFADSRDDREIKNTTNAVVADDDPAFPVVVAQPYNGQFMQIDGVLPL